VSEFPSMKPGRIEPILGDIRERNVDATVDAPHASLRVGGGRAEFLGAVIRARRAPSVRATEADREGPDGQPAEWYILTLGT
jgi:O-acetyl-ADP-ribose deacetylase (regulator of RNase III)